MRRLTRSLHRNHIDAESARDIYSIFKNTKNNTESFDAQAFVMGAIDAVTYGKIGGKTSGKFLVELAKQMGIEYGEEWFTEGLNLMSDALVMQSQSELRQMLDYYKAEGLSDGQAFWEVTKESLGKMHDAGVSGAIGAIVGGGIGGTVGQVQKNAEYKKEGQTVLENDGYNALKSLALEVAGATKGADSRLVNRLAKAADKKTTAKNVGKLSDAVDSIRTKQNTSDISAELKKAGLSSREAKQVAQYMSDSIDGKSLSETDQQNLETILTENDAVLEVWNGLANQQVVVGKKLSASHPVNVRNEQHNLGRKGVVVEEDGIYATENTPEPIRKVLEGNSFKDKEMTSVDDLRLSEDGVTRVASTGEAVTVDKSNPIAKVEEVDGKRVVYYNTDQGQVAEDDIAFGNEDEAILYESFTDLNPAIANVAIKNYGGSLPAQVYAKAMRQGITMYGQYNFQGVGKDISMDSDFALLSAEDQSLALKLGRKMAEIKTSSLDQGLKAAIREAAKHTQKDSKGKPSNRGTVIFEDKVKAKTDRQKETVRFADLLSKVTGIHIVFYDSKIDPSHEFAKDDGASNHDTIWLDMSNSHDDAIVYTLSHEFVHFAKKWSPKEYKVFTDFMVEQFSDHGKSLDELVRQKMGEIGTNDYDYAFEEVVADACERMLLDSNAMEKLALLKKESPNVFKKFMQHIKELLEKLKLLHADTHTTNDYSAALHEMTDVLEKFYELFENMAVDAVRNFQKIEGTEVDTHIHEKKYSIKHPRYSQQDLQNNMKSIAKQKSVYDVSAEKLKRTGKRPGDIFTEFFDSLGNNLYVEEFGDISLSKSSVKSEIRHGITAEKIASIEAIPAVLKEGKVIFFEAKEDSDVDRIVVCAPITIGNKPYYMGVMLQRDSQNQRLYLHNVVIEEEMPASSQADLLTTGALEDNKHLFISSIIRRALNVKQDMLEKSAKTVVSERGKEIKKQAKKKDNGKLDPRTVTEGDVRGLLEDVKCGKISGHTYFPIRINTPSTLIYWANERRGDVIDNNPIAIDAEKAYQAMARSGQDTEGRPHEMSVDDIISVIKGMSDPQYIVYQGGNGRYVEVIGYTSESGRKAFAILEIGEDKDSVYMNGYDGGLYNILVTTFPPDSGKLKALLENPKNEVVFDKKKDESQRSSSSIVPSLLNDSPFFKESISQPSDGVKSQKKRSSNRTILANTLESTIDISTQEGKNELIMLQKYQADIGKIEELENRLAEINAELKEISFEKGKRDVKRQRELSEEKTKLVNKIDIYDRRILKYEATKPIKDLLAREKEKIRKQYRAEGSERVRVALNRKNDSIRLKKEKENLQKLVLETTVWLTKPKKGEIPCPDIIKEPFAELLAGIDTSSKKLLTKGVATQSDLKFAMAMDSLATAVEKIKNSQDPGKEDSDGTVIDHQNTIEPSPLCSVSQKS